MNEKIICYDIDGTLTTEMLFVPLIQSEHNNGILDDISYKNITETLGVYKRGEIAYEDAVQQLIEKHANGLAEKEVQVVASHAIEFVKAHTDLFRPFARSVIHLLNNSYHQIAVTAEPQYVADAVSKYLGLSKAFASIYETRDGAFTGAVTSSLANRSQKAKLLVGYDVFAAFGDSEGDIDMLASAQRAVCINPSITLRHRAEDEGWTILNGDEDATQIIEYIR